MARELNLYGDDVSHWCDSCGVALEDDDRELCDECEDDAEKYEADRLSAKQQRRRERVRAAHCREEAQSDLFELAADVTRNYAALLRRTG